MKIFQGKYLVVSLVIHLAVISSFLLFQKSSEEAETSMLVTEIIKIEEERKLFGQVDHTFQIKTTCKRARKGLFDAT